MRVDRTDKVVPTYEATFGGPIRKDRIWFFGAGRYQKNELGAGAAARGINERLVPADQQGQAVRGKAHRHPLRKPHAHGSYTGGRRAGRTTPSRFPILETNGTSTTGRCPGPPLGELQRRPHERFFLEAAVLGEELHVRELGRNRFNELIKGTADRRPGPRERPDVRRDLLRRLPSPENRDNNDILGKGTYFLSTKGLGSHNIVSGLRRTSTQAPSNNWQSGSSWLFSPRLSVPTGRTSTRSSTRTPTSSTSPIPLVSQGSDLQTDSVFVNDTWRLNNNFSFNLGVR